MPRSDRQRLAASPAWPAPMTTVVTCSMMLTPIDRGWPGLRDFDGYVRRIGDDVVHRRALLRLRHDRLDLLLRRVGVDVEGDLDVVVAVADVAVDAQDPLDVHRAF